MAVLALACIRGEDTGFAAGEGDAALRARAAALHRDAIVVDGHNDVTTFLLDYGFDLGMDGSGAHKRDATLYWVPVVRSLLPTPDPASLRMDTDLARLREGGVDAQFFSIFVDTAYVPDSPMEVGRAHARAVAMIESVYEQVRRHPERLELATRVADIRRISAEGRIAALLGVEGGHAIENDLDILRELYALGARYMTLTWSNANDWADSCYEEPHGGLTAFGRKVVEEMNRLGMMVDISHVSDATFFDTLEATRAPVIASHSSARALSPIPRNLSDEMLRAVAANGGVVMLAFQEQFLDPAKAGAAAITWHVISNGGWVRSPASLLIDHIDHVARIAGIDHVGLGSDFAGGFNMPAGLRSVADFPVITLELLRRGYSEDDVRKVLGGNLLRVMEAVEAVAEAPAPPPAL